MDFNALLGKTLTRIEGKVGGDEILLETNTGGKFKLYHSQDCCESVSVEDIAGDLQDLIGEPLLEAEEATSREDLAGRGASEYRDSFTWTFYKLRTRKGGVTIRWYGESNGHYSESVDFGRVR